MEDNAMRSQGYEKDTEISHANSLINNLSITFVFSQKLSAPFSSIVKAIISR